MIYLIYALLCLIWGSTWMAIKIGLAEAPPLYASGIRFMLAAAVVWIIMLIRGCKLPKTAAEFFKRGLPGVFTYGASYSLVYFAQQHVSSAMASILFASFPMFVALISLGLLRADRIKLIGWLGLVVGFVGIVVISHDSLEISGSLFWGTIMGIAASAVSALGTVLHKKWFADEDIVTSAGVQMLFGFVPVMIDAVLFEDISQFAINARSIGSLLYLAILGSVVTFLGYYWLLAKMNVVKVAVIGYITPVVAIVIGVAGADEKLTAATLIGGALILLGVFVTGRGTRG